MKQSNALRNLDVILEEAVSNGNRNELSGPILLGAMGIENKPQNIVDFYEILNKAQREAEEIKNLPRLPRYINLLEELRQIFVTNHLWNTKWNTFASHIENRSILIALDALANHSSSQSPKSILEKDFLNAISDEFSTLLSAILKSDLPKGLQRFLVERIEDILRSIRSYYIDGTEGIEKAAKSLVSDLGMVEHNLDSKSRSNSLYIKTKAWAIGLLLYITPTPYDIIGSVPDLQEFWVPKVEELAANYGKVEQIVLETSTIHEALEKSAGILYGQSQNILEGSKEPKALPASKEDINTESQI